MFVFTGPRGVESRAEKVDPALAELLFQSNPLYVNNNTLDVVSHETKLKEPIALDSIAGSRVAVSRLTNRGNADKSATGNGSVDSAM
jgi:hypothetical protein